MSLTINTNLMSANIARTLNTHYKELATSTQRLSSGLRINGASDDAAGLAIRELMRADVAALHQGVRNANDAISMIQVVDGALGIIDEKLIRMKELAEQAATGTYDSTQRLMIDSEFQAMASEIERIANATDFNGIKLLNSAYNLDGFNKYFINNFEKKDFSINHNYVSLLHDGGKTVSLDDNIITTTTNTTEISKYILDDGNIFKETYINENIEILNETENYFIDDQIYSATNWFVWGNEPRFNAEIINKEIFNELGDGKVLYDVLETYPILDLSYRYENNMDKYTNSSSYMYRNNIWTWHVDLNYDGNPDILINMFSQRYIDESKFKNNEVKLNQLRFNIGKKTSSSTIVDKKYNKIEKLDYIPDEIKGNITIHFGYNNKENYDNYIIKKYDCTISGLGLNGIRIETQDNGQHALVAIDDAIVKKDQARAYYGAMQNRLENTVSNLTIQAENLQTSESRISDVDVATEMINFVRNQILTQSAVSMLAQANSLPQMAMQLIGG